MTRKTASKTTSKTSRKAPAPSAKILSPGGAYVPLPTRGKAARRSATDVNDFRPGVDKVLRDIDGRVWVVDGEGRYAPVEVWEPPVSALAPLPPGLTPARLRMMYAVTAGTPYLSEEGRAERLSSIQDYVAARGVTFEVVS